MRQRMIEQQQYWNCHGMKCLYSVLFNQNSGFLGNNIAIIMTFNIHRTCCLTEIYLKISKHNTIFIVSQCNTHPAMLFWQRGISYEKSSK